MEIKRIENGYHTFNWVIQFTTKEEACRYKNNCEEAFGKSRVEYHERSKKPYWIECTTYQIAELIVEANKQR